MKSFQFTRFLIQLHVMALLTLLIIRLGFALIHYEAILKNPVLTIIHSLLVGALIDSSVICILFMLPLICYSILELLFNLDLKKYFFWTVLPFLLLVFFINMIDIYYFKQYGTRLNLMVSEGIQRYAIIFSLIWKSYPVVKLFLCFIILSIVFIIQATKLFKKIDSINHNSLKWSIAQLVYLVALSFIYYGPPFWYLTSFSSSTTINQMSSNGVYTFFKAIDQKKIFDRDLASYDYHEQNSATKQLQQSIVKSNERLIDTYYPTLREFVTPNNIKAKNIVIIMMESFAAKNIGCLGGKKISPNFDRYADKGFLFTDCFASGVRTQHGLTAVVGSFPPLLGSSLIRRKGFIEFSTIGNLLQQANYQTVFLHNGHSSYGDTDFFLKQGGFEFIGDEKDYKSWKFRNELGVSDEDLFDKAFTELQNESQSPKLTLLLTMSNHAPHEVPADFINKFPSLKALDKKEISFAYADYALGKFLDSCQRLTDYNNTLFLVVADHGEIYDESDFGYKLFHIPALLLNSSHGKGTFTKTCSQIDFAPTLLYEAGYKLPLNCLGQNLFASDYKPFAFSKDYESKITLTYDKIAMQWDMRTDSPAYYTVTSNKHLIPNATINNSVKKEMKLFTENYLQTISYLYRNGRYRIRN